MPKLTELHPKSFVSNFWGAVHNRCEGYVFLVLLEALEITKTSGCISVTCFCFVEHSGLNPWIIYVIIISL